MRLLFAILILAVVGLLWATVATVRYIRKARQRQVLEGERQVDAAPSALSSSKTSQTAHKHRLLSPLI